MSNPLELPFFFIIGRPRSGTTLLRTLLDAHPAIIVPPEYPIILDLFNRFGTYPEWNSCTRGKLLQTFKKPLTFDFWNYQYLRIEEEALKSDLEEIRGRVPLEKVLRLFYFHSQSVFPKENIQLLGDKNPVYALYTRHLLRWFPDAKFLFITRDYRDNLVSMRKFDWEAPHPVLQAWRWKYITRMMLRLQRQHPGRIFMLRYEDLVAQPEEWLKKICSFLQISYNPVMLSFHEKVEEGFSFIDRKTLLKYHESLVKPINTSTIGLWKEKLSRREVHLMDATVGLYAEKADYRRSSVDNSLALTLATWPMRIYGWILYQLMLLGEYLPYRLRVLFSKALPWLVKVYRKLKG
ncbi:MAG: sulfotransferase family protein [Bacteroidales bacterium]